MAKASDFRVSVSRDGEGAIAVIDVRERRTDGLLATYDDPDSVERLISEARDLAGSDPHDGGLIPDDRYLIEAALLECGLTLEAEG